MRIGFLEDQWLKGLSMVWSQFRKYYVAVFFFLIVCNIATQICCGCLDVGIKSFLDYFLIYLLGVLILLLLLLSNSVKLVKDIIKCLLSDVLIRFTNKYCKIIRKYTFTDSMLSSSCIENHSCLFLQAVQAHTGLTCTWRTWEQRRNISL